MNYLSGIMTGLLCLFLLTTCSKYEITPVTKVSTISVKQVSLDIEAIGKIVEARSSADTDHGFFYARHDDPGPADYRRSAGNPVVGQFSVLIQGLQPNTTYYVRAYCRDDDGYHYGQTLSLRTTDGKITVVTDRLVHRSSDEALVSGRVISSAGLEVTARGVCWNTSPAPTLHHQHTVDGAGLGSFTAELTQLEPATQYYVRAYATNMAGTAYGEEISFVTLEDGTLEDVEGNIYQTVTIGNQEWMAENLRVTRYSNGQAISTGLTHMQWEHTASGAYAVYSYEELPGFNNPQQVVNAFGLLYNWHAVNDSKGLCPPGWRVPSSDDWSELMQHLEQLGYMHPANKLKSCRQVGSPQGLGCNTFMHPRWDAHDTHYGTDDFGFSALPGGQRHDNGEYVNVGKLGNWWTSSGLGEMSAWQHSLHYNSGVSTRSATGRNMGLSVRCVKE
ncbi:MAG: fibrobacter succinogenes major paralogous domain-containing protein [Bacteroidales bacterium]|nr:fibrobacter succinogenes major paralogous domain-containing protein [Bacteroidales bacterium]